MSTITILLLQITTFVINVISVISVINSTHVHSNPLDQIELREELCQTACDDSDYVQQGISADTSRKQSIPSPFGSCSLHFPSHSEHMLAGRASESDAQHGRDDAKKECHQFQAP
jgi:hypothetical protein